MRRERWSVAGVLTIFGCCLPVAAQPQQPPPGLPLPRVLIVTPTGGKAGESVEVTLTGSDLDSPQGLWFSHPGIKAEPLGVAEPPGPAQRKDGRRGMQGTLGPLMSQRFKVVIPADAPIGIHDVRLVNAFGVSNPRAFVVGDLAEVVEKEPNNDVAEAQRVALNATINGAISSPTDVDDFVFEGKKGLRVLLSGLASSIDSRLLMAVELYDASGKRLATGHEYQGTDALLDATLPADGDYLVRVFAFTYSRGGPEHFYRLDLSTAPWIDAVVPPVVEPGKRAQVTLFGRNLPGGRPDPSAVVDGRVLDRLDTIIEVPSDPTALAFRGHLPPAASLLDGFEYRARNEAGTSNPFLLTFAKAPVVLDRGNNETPETAQPVALPCEIAGRIEAPRDRDWYAFEAKKGDVNSIEAFGERLGSPLDLYFVLRNPRTKAVLGEFDEGAEAMRRGQLPSPAHLQFFTTTGDPDRDRFVAPEDGRYELMVSSREAPSLAGPRHYYRVRITPEQPDFRLVLLPTPLTPPSRPPNLSIQPDACVLRQGGRMEATVWVWRLDGFSGPIALTAEGLPEGVTCPPRSVRPDATLSPLILVASDDAPAWTGAITIKGTATIDGKPVVREARSATVTWSPPLQQLNIPAVSRLDRGLALAVRDRPPFRLTAEPEQLSADVGEKAAVTLKFERTWPDFKGPIEAQVVGVPGGVSANDVSLTGAGPGEAKSFLQINANALPGVYTIFFRGRADVPFAKDPNAKQKPNVNVTYPSTPVTLTIHPKELAKVTITPNTPTARAGQSAAVTVRVARLYEYSGPFQVELIVPPDVKGLTPIAPITLPAGQNEVKLTLPIAPDALAGPRPNLKAKVTARFLDQLTTQEVTFAVHVTR